MPYRLLLTLSTTFALGGVYGGYAHFVNPLVKPSSEAMTPITRQETPPLTQPKENVRAAEKHLTNQPWTSNAKFQLKTEDAFVFAENWDPQEEDGTIRFRPFAIIWDQKGRKPDEPPITIISESAVVKFEGKLDLESSDPGKILGGAFEGNVEISGPDGLNVKGRNFFFSEAAMRIWSDHPVAFQHGPHRGGAKNGMQIELIPDEVERKQNKLSIVGIRNVQLRRDVTMDLSFQQEETKPPVIVQVRCAGSFAYRLEDRFATFEEDVRVYRPTGNNQHDSLKCEYLFLQFDEEAQPEKIEPVLAAADSSEDPGEQSPNNRESKNIEAEETEEDEFKGLSSKLAFRSLRAEGPEVILMSEANDLSARMTRLQYEMKSQQIIMSDPQKVKVFQQASELRCPQIVMKLDEKNNVTHVWCQGAGSLDYYDPKNNAHLLRTNWEKQLRKTPGNQPGLDVIELVQKAMVQQPTEQVALGAEHIKLWVQNVPEPKEARSSTNENGEEKPNRLRTRVRPDRLLAMNDVKLFSREMRGKTKRLEVWFEQATGLDSAAGEQLASGETSETQPVQQTAGESNSEKSKKPINPVEIQSDVIRIRVLTGLGKNAKKAQVAEIWTVGKLDVKQQRDAGKPPFAISGDRMHLVNHSQDSQVITLLGEPAHLRDQGMHIEGKLITFDRAANLATVTGAGLLQLPVKQSLEGEVLEKPQLLDVWWNEEMTFDGGVAKFFGDVRAVLADSKMHCQQMHVTLSKKFSFQDAETRPNTREVELERVECKDGVLFESYEYEKDQLVEIRKTHFWEFTLNQSTGNTEAWGPGWINFWRRGRGKRAALTPNATVIANQPVKSTPTQWEYTRVEFVGKVTGNLKERTSTFTDRVQIVYGPVERSLMTIDIDNLPKDGGSMRCKQLQIKQYPKTKTQEAWVELLATGNAELEGRSFHARADSISYDEGKELYILRSFGNRKATIWRQQIIGGREDRAEAQRMEFIPSRNQLKFHRATSLGGSQ